VTAITTMKDISFTIKNWATISINLARGSTITLRIGSCSLTRVDGGVDLRWTGSDGDVREGEEHVKWNGDGSDETGEEGEEDEEE
jgi:hypothetical protein